MQKALRLLIALYNWLPIKRVQTINLMPIGTAKLSIAMACHISTTYQLATTVGTGNLVKTALHANLLAIQLQNTGNSHHLALPFHWVKPKKHWLQINVPKSKYPRAGRKLATSRQPTELLSIQGKGTQCTNVLPRTTDLLFFMQKLTLLAKLILKLMLLPPQVA